MLICVFGLISETMKEYGKLMGEFEGLAMRMVFESYGVEKERCDSFMESNNHLLRFLKSTENQRAMRVMWDCILTQILPFYQSCINSI